MTTHLIILLALGVCILLLFLRKCIRLVKILAVCFIVYTVYTVLLARGIVPNILTLWEVK